MGQAVAEARDMELWWMDTLMEWSLLGWHVPFAGAM